MMMSTTSSRRKLPVRPRKVFCPLSKRSGLNTGSPYEKTVGFSRAVRIGNQIHVSGTGPVGADQADIAEQTRQCLTLITAALKNAGSSIEHVYRTRMYLTRTEDWEAAGHSRTRWVAVQGIGAPFVIGFFAAIVYFFDIRRQVVRAGLRRTVEVTPSASL